jgi:iron complex outermembrane receptor protein
VLAPQAYVADVDDTNLSGQFTVAYQVVPRVNTYATYATSFKSVGLNLNGVPTDALGNPVLSAATVKPEDVGHLEAGVKTEPLRNVTLNFSVFDTEIEDFQAQVVNASVGVLRGNLANARRCACAASSSTATRASARTCRSTRRARSRRQVRVLHGRAAAARGNRRAAGEGRVGLGSPGISKQAVSFGGEYVAHGSVLSRRASSSAPSTPATARRSRRAPARRSTSSWTATGCSTSRRLPRHRGLDAVGVVAQPAQQGLLELLSASPATLASTWRSGRSAHP